MVKLTYPGPLAAVSIPSLGLTVKRGGSAEVPDDVADQLVDQGWKAAAEKSPNTTKKAAPAAATKES